MIDYTGMVAENENKRIDAVKAAFLPAFAAAYPDAPATDGTLEAIAAIADTLVEVSDDMAVASRSLDAMLLAVLAMHSGLAADAEDTAAENEELATLKAENYRLTATLNGVKSVLSQTGAYVDLVYQARRIIKNSLTDAGDEA
jgi:hypothetical protein